MDFSKTRLVPLCLHEYISYFLRPERDNLNSNPLQHVCVTNKY